jgi:hypothetical protein
VILIDAKDATERLILLENVMFDPPLREGLGRLNGDQERCRNEHSSACGVDQFIEEDVEEAASRKTD